MFWCCWIEEQLIATLGLVYTAIFSITWIVILLRNFFLCCVLCVFCILIFYVLTAIGVINDNNIYCTWTEKQTNQNVVIFHKTRPILVTRKFAIFSRVELCVKFSKHCRMTPARHLGYETWNFDVEVPQSCRSFGRWHQGISASVGLHELLHCA